MADPESQPQSLQNIEMVGVIPESEILLRAAIAEKVASERAMDSADRFLYTDNFLMNPKANAFTAIYVAVQRARGKRHLRKSSELINAAQETRRAVRMAEEVLGIDPN